MYNISDFQIVIALWQRTHTKMGSSTGTPSLFCERSQSLARIGLQAFLSACVYWSARACRSTRACGHAGEWVYWGVECSCRRSNWSRPIEGAVARVWYIHDCCAAIMCGHSYVNTRGSRYVARLHIHTNCVKSMWKEWFVVDDRCMCGFCMPSRVDVNGVICDWGFDYCRAVRWE